MIHIAHRGNISGKNEQRENTPSYIDKAITLGYDVEIDVWYTDGKLLLGHDHGQWVIDEDFLFDRFDKLWCHAKNIAALTVLSQMSRQDLKLHYFWHESDTVTLTNKGVIWASPGKQPINNSIAVLPELHRDLVLSDCLGICSDDFKTVRRK